MTRASRSMMKWFRGVYERIRAVWAKILLDRAVGRFAAALQSEALDAFLETLLRVMNLALRVDPEFRRNIVDYDVRYVFRSKDGSIVTSAEFRDGRMKVHSGAIDNPDITVTFKDNKALEEFLFTEKPDLIASILDNEISYVGNINYLGKLAYMAKHLQLRFAAAVG